MSDDDYYGVAETIEVPVTLRVRVQARTKRLAAKEVTRAIKGLHYHVTGAGPEGGYDVELLSARRRRT